MCNILHLCEGHGICVSGLTFSEYTRLHNEAHGLKCCQPKLAFNPTPQPVVDEMLTLLYLTEGDILYDIGCGDGRVIKTAAQKYGCKALGIEINPQTAAIAKRNIKGVKNVKVQIADATKLDLSAATAVFMYLPTDVMDKIVPELKATRIISYMHPIKRKGIKQYGSIYVWDKFRGGL
jgi:SAM-dependent methyltransferase